MPAGMGLGMGGQTPWGRAFGMMRNSGFQRRLPSLGGLPSTPAQPNPSMQAQAGPVKADVGGVNQALAEVQAQQPQPQMPQQPQMPMPVSKMGQDESSSPNPLARYLSKTVKQASQDTLSPGFAPSQVSQSPGSDGSVYSISLPGTSRYLGQGSEQEKAAEVRADIETRETRQGVRRAPSGENDAAGYLHKTSFWKHAAMSAISSYLTKTASQDNTAPQRSETGGSHGLSFAHRADDYAQGQAAWAATSRYFKGGGKIKEEPNPFKGKHRGTEKMAALRRTAAWLTKMGFFTSPDNTGRAQPVSRGQMLSREELLRRRQARQAQQQQVRSMGQTNMMLDKTASSGPMMPSRLIGRLVPLGERRGDKQMTAEEYKQLQDGQDQWIPEPWQTDSTPIPSLMASPHKQGLMAGVAGGAVGAGAGYGLGKLSEKLLGTGSNSGTVGAALGGVGVGALAGLLRLKGQRRRNEHLEEIMRRMPPGATRHDYVNMEMLWEALMDRFGGEKISEEIRSPVVQGGIVPRGYALTADASGNAVPDKRPLRMRAAEAMALKKPRPASPAPTSPMFAQPNVMGMNTNQLGLGGNAVIGRNITNPRTVMQLQQNAPLMFKGGEDVGPFAQAFLRRCVEHGLSAEQIKQGIDQIGQQFGKEASDELHRGLEKVAGPADGAIRTGLRWLTREAAPKAMNFGRGLFGKEMQGITTRVAHPTGGSMYKTIMPSGYQAGQAMRTAMGNAGIGQRLSSGATTGFAAGVASPALTHQGHMDPNTGRWEAGNSHLFGMLPFDYKAALGGFGAGFAAPGRIGQQFIRRPLGTSAAGSMIGMTADELGEMAGFQTNGRFAQAGAWAGLGAGTPMGRRMLSPQAVRAGEQFGMPKVWLPYGQARGTGREWIGQQVGKVSPRIGNWIEQSGQRLQQTAAKEGLASKLGRRTMLGVAGAGAGVGIGGEMIKAKAQQGVAEMAQSPEFQGYMQEQGNQMIDNYLAQYGMTKEDLGQMLQQGKGMQGMGGLLSGLSGIGDQILGAFGMDPKAMSGTQKLMLLLGGGGLLAGLMGGSGGLAGLGGLAMAGGLMGGFPGLGGGGGGPTPAQSQGRGGPEMVYNPTTGQMEPSPYLRMTKPNQLGARSELAVQQKLQQGGSPAAAPSPAASQTAMTDEAVNQDMIA